MATRHGPIAGKGILALEFDEHRAHLKMLNAAFTPENIRRLGPVVHRKAAELGLYMDGAIGAGDDEFGVLDCTETFRKAMMGVICVAIFGTDPANIRSPSSGGAMAAGKE
ncbi:cytochrome P450 [Apiospora marii]|uniref:cytochrome P450 n=1 Tax=Apiospora marii TaxID=335849 RepID=UPI003131D0BD